MKIDGTLIGQAVEESAKTPAPQSPGAPKGSKNSADGDAFATLLQNAVEATGSAGGQDSAAVYGPTGLPGPWSAPPIVQGQAQPSATSETLSSLNSVLDGLDSLHNALLATNSPREINSLIQQVNEQAQGLNDKTSALPADSKLKNLAEETKVAAYMESIKWRRGDYL